MKKRPYIKKIIDIGGFKVWYVNGYWVRNHLDREFTNFGNNRNFVFIPKDEFWIDTESGKREAEYFINNFLIIQEELKKGKTYELAFKIANRIEKAERGKSKFLQKLKKIKIKKEILKKIHKKVLFKKYTDKIKIWLVRGDLVRSLFFIDFTQGGHDKVYNFVPKNEIWIDDAVYNKEIPFILVHELHERKLMLKGWKYDPKGVGVFSRKGDNKGKSAHFVAEDLEFWCRHHPKSIKTKLLKEIKENEKLS